MDPPAILAGGLGSRPMIERPKVDLPHPDSPTTASSLFGGTSRLTLSTAFNFPSKAAYSMVRSRTERRFFSVKPGSLYRESFCETRRALGLLRRPTTEGERSGLDYLH